MFSSKAQQFLMLEYYLYTGTTCFGQLVTIFRSLRALIYRVSQVECARLREGVPYVKVYRYNPKHLCPKLNGYGDNGQRKVWSSGGSTHCTCQLTALSYVTSLSVVSYDGYSAHASDKLHMYFLQGDDVVSHVTSLLGIHVIYSVWNP